MTPENIIALAALAVSMLGGFFLVVRYLLGRIDVATASVERDLSQQWERAKDHFAPLADFSALVERIEALDRRSVEILAEVKELRR